MTAPKRPKHIQICGTDYRVMYGQPGKMLITADSNNLGLTDVLRSEIHILDSAPQQLNDTLLHEIQHAIWFGAGLDHLVARAGVNEPKDFEELFIRIQTPHLLSVIRQGVVR